jgi:hypothetical protein
MAKRWLRSRSVTREEDSFDNEDNVDLDSNSSYLESEADSESKFYSGRRCAKF